MLTKPEEPLFSLALPPFEKDFFERYRIVLQNMQLGIRVRVRKCPVGVGIWMGSWRRDGA